ncbi:MAG: deaminase [Thermoguttaceae bacterium]
MSDAIQRGAFERLRADFRSFLDWSRGTDLRGADGAFDSVMEYQAAWGSREMERQSKISRLVHRADRLLPTTLDLNPPDWNGFLLRFCGSVPDDLEDYCDASIEAIDAFLESASIAPSAAGGDVVRLGEKAVGDGKNDGDLDRRFMERAVEEARKSTVEDGRVHPKVGVVVAKGGKELAVAHRGELGPGDHAEFTALEKKLADQVVAGATVYTTLEPCTSRRHPKVPCVDRLIERKVVRVVIGMLDPNRTISGQGQMKLRKARIAVSLFDDDLQSEIEEINRDFIRQHDAGGGPPSTDGGR